jgi:hypothetical protein
MRNYKVITPLFPTYAQTRAMMKAIAGYSVKSVRNMITAIQEQTGTPQNPVDWSEPDIWLKKGSAARMRKSPGRSGKQITMSLTRATATVVICLSTTRFSI